MSNRSARFRRLSSEQLEMRRLLASDVTGVLAHKAALVADINQTPRSYRIRAVEQTASRELHLLAEAPTGGVEIWRTDGTPDRTSVVATLPDADCRGDCSLETLDGDLFFTTSVTTVTPASGADSVASDTISSVVNLWRLADQPHFEGTIASECFCPQEAYTDSVDLRFVDAGQNSLIAVTSTRDDGFATASLYAPTGGLTRFANFSFWSGFGPADGPYRSKPMSNLVAWEGEFVFGAGVDSGTSGLWQANPAEQTTELIRGDFRGVIEEVRSVNGTLYFSVRANDYSQLWRSNGTLEGTRLLKEFPHPGATSRRPLDITEVDDGIVFRVTETRGTSIWKSDGTNEGTRPLQAGEPGRPESPPGPPVTLDGHPVTFSGDVVYVTHAETSARDELLKLPTGSAGTQMWEPATTSHDFYFVTQQDQLLSLAATSGELTQQAEVNYATPYRENEVRKGGLETVGDELFTYRSGSPQTGLFDTPNPAEVFRFNPDTRDFETVWNRWNYGIATQNGVASSTSSEEALYLLLQSGTQAEIWEIPTETDGMAREITSIRTNWPWRIEGDQIDFEYSSNKLFFVTPDSLARLLSVAGDGTILTLADSVVSIAPAGEMLYYLRNSRKGSERFLQLWRADGTQESNTLVFESKGTASRKSLATTDGKLFFGDTDGGLWVKDDHIENASRIFEFPSPVAESEDTPKILGHRGFAYFSADDGIHGQELWMSDGTTEGTVLAADIFPGPASSAPATFTIWEEQLYLSANNGIQGRELWSIDLPNIPVGDLDENGQVDFADFLILSANFGTATDQGPVAGDIDNDGEVRYEDFLLLAMNFKKGS